MGKIQQVVRILKDSLHELNVETDERLIEESAVTIHAAMSGATRVFHDHEHVFALCSGSRHPLQRIASLFHDVVYHQVDGGFGELSAILSELLVETPKGIEVGPACEHSLHRQIVLQVFGHRPGIVLSPFGGLNEFASALVMVEFLHPLLSPEHITTAAAHIEATIPFRTAAVGDDLADRLAGIKRRYGLALSNDGIKHIVRLAIDLANRDVDNFSETPASFLSNTWRLLPETNQPLRATASYSVRDYRTAIQKMDGFFAMLDPSAIFHQYDNMPSDSEYIRLCINAKRNVAVAREYLRVKLLTACILEAMAEESGGNMPMAMLMGDADGSHSRLEDYLPSLAQTSTDVNFAVLQLLDYGRQDNSRFDVRNSPLSLFVYQSLGSRRMAHQIGRAKAMVSGEDSAADFLAGLPQKMISPIAKAGAMMADTRQVRLLELAGG